MMINVKGLTVEQKANLSGHIEAARRLLPWKEVLQSLANCSEQERADLLESVMKEDYSQEAKNVVGVKEEDVSTLKEFIRLFSRPMAPEAYTHLMGTLESSASKSIHLPNGIYCLKVEDDVIVCGHNDGRFICTNECSHKAKEPVLECIKVGTQVLYCAHEKGELICTDECSYREG